MQYDRKARQAFRDFLQNVKTEPRLLAGLKFVRAVAGPDGDGQGIDAGAFDKVLHLVRIGVLSLVVRDADRVFHPGEPAEFGLDGYMVPVGVLDHFSGLLHIFLVRLG